MTSQGHGLKAATARYRSAFVTVAILSAVLNVLLLGGSIHMMLVYDTVLPSHSIPTLFGLLGMVVVVYLFQGLFEAMRGRILSDVGIALERDLSARVQRAMSRLALRTARGSGDGLTPMRDLDQIRAFLSSGGPAALIDLPWIVFFLAILFVLHVWLGVTALVGALVLVALTAAANRATRAPTAAAVHLTALRNGQAEAHLRHVEVLAALGMRERVAERWSRLNDRYLASQNELAQSVAVLGGASRLFRLFLQSAILTVGALLVIDGRASGGVIFASSILASRALAPVDSTIANWRGFAAARAGWTRLEDLFARIPEQPQVQVALPRPTRELTVEQLFAGPPASGRTTIGGVAFTLRAGEALGVIGPSAAGKTTLARALVGVWPASRGEIRMDGATLDQWDPEVLGAFVGYLPQSVELLDGSVAENIARFTPDAPSDAVIAAARAAGVHDLVVALPQGYDTPVGGDGSALSAGQRQRIGLARALYGDPFLVLLDEPNSNLDAAGEVALEAAIASVRKRGGIAIVIAHRPSALAQVSHVLFLRDGRQEAFGERDEVLRKIAPRPTVVPSGATSRPNITTLRGVT